MNSLKNYEYWLSQYNKNYMTDKQKKKAVSVYKKKLKEYNKGRM